LKNNFYKTQTMFPLFEQTAFDCSRNITQLYSTSFSLGIKTLHKKLHNPIYAIYGMVRYADEIVDTFHDFDKKTLLDKFRRDTFEAIEQKISLNPVLYAFQKTVNEFSIPLDLIEAFFKSMEMDLHQTAYGKEGYNEYIYGSAEVVGLMCLKIFTNGNTTEYEKLMPAAKALGAAFQKVNFLRDMKDDYQERGRVYFPGIDFGNFRDEAKAQIEKEIEDDFIEAYYGIIKLPIEARAGVMLAYKYYIGLFERIKRVPVEQIKHARIRVPDIKKLVMLFETLTEQHVSALFSFSS